MTCETCLKRPSCTQLCEDVEAQLPKDEPDPGHTSKPDFSKVHEVAKEQAELRRGFEWKGQLQEQFQLNPDDDLFLELFENEGWPLKRIAAHFDISPKYAKIKHARIMERLRKKGDDYRRRVWKNKNAEGGTD